MATTVYQFGHFQATVQDKTAEFDALTETLLAYEVEISIDLTGEFMTYVHPTFSHAAFELFQDMVADRSNGDYISVTSAAYGRYYSRVWFDAAALLNEWKDQIIILKLSFDPENPNDVST